MLFGCRFHGFTLSSNLLPEMLNPLLAETLFNFLRRKAASKPPSVNIVRAVSWRTMARCAEARLSGHTVPARCSASRGCVQSPRRRAFRQPSTFTPFATSLQRI
jgi:hypothetical protein